MTRLVSLLINETPKDMTLEQALEHAAARLPDGWQIRIEIENGAGWVEAIRPDQSTVMMDDTESDLVEMVLAALRLAFDEIAAEKLSQANEKGQR